MSLSVTVAWAEGADRSLPLPAYQSAGAAGADLRANLPEAVRAGGVTLATGERAATGALPATISSTSSRRIRSTTDILRAGHRGFTE